MLYLFIVLCFNLATSVTPSVAPSIIPTASPSGVRSTMNSILTIAGTGGSGYTGVGGAPTAALFNYPFGLWKDSLGYLYVSDQYGDCVRKFSTTTASSVLQLVAGQCGVDGYGGDGGPATSAIFSLSMGLAISSSGLIYVGEQNNNRVRLISSGKISTYAGTGASGFNGDGGPASAATIPTINGVWLNTVGVLFVVMMASGTIRAVDTSTGIITKYAGGYSASYSGDGGPATSAKFSTFARVSGDTNGVMYIGDSSNFVVRKISASGIVSLYGGTFSTVYTGPENVAFTSFSTGSVRDIAVDPNNGDIYASSTGTYRIFVQTGSTGLVSTYAGRGSIGDTPTSTGDGGPATSATFNYNDGIWLDSSSGQLTMLELVGNKARLVYSVSPSATPTIHPTPSPSVLPSRPTNVPTFSPTLVPYPIRRSPSYKVENAFAFAGLTSSGSVMTWGASKSGGDSSSVSSLLVDVTAVVGSKNAFAAVKSDGSVVAWGHAHDVSGYTSYSTSTNVASLVATERAFAGLTYEGGVIAFGAGCCGGNVDEYGSWSTLYLSSGVESIVANAGAFCALKLTGTVYCWGSAFTGGGVSSEGRSDLSDVVLLVATRSAFAALKSDGSVVSWGNKYFGGEMPSNVSSALSMHTLHIVSSEVAFVAYTDTMMLYSWSSGDLGGGADLSEPDGVQYVAHTSRSFAALRTNNSLVSWGSASEGGDSSDVASELGNVTHVEGNRLAFAAITSAGKVVSWGDVGHGGHPAANVTTRLHNVTAVFHTSRAFAALNFSGSVITWGSSEFGGEADSSVSDYLNSDVKLICSNDISFTAIRHDGYAVQWGSSYMTGVSAVVLSGNYSTIISC